VRALR